MYVNLMYLYLTLHFQSFFSFFLVLFSLLYSPVDTFVSFAFQFVLQLVSFLIGEYHFWFRLFTGSIYRTLLSWTVLILLMAITYACICHYFNYYLPDFVIAICVESSLVSHFWVFVLIPFNAITNHMWNLCSWSEIKRRALEWEH